MGTRALYFIDDPTEIDDEGFTKAEWAGAIAWDGYPDGFDWPEITTEEQFRDWISKEIATRDDYASPDGGFPFPWADKIFLTDFTYYFADGAVRVVEAAGATISEAMSDDFDWEGCQPKATSDTPAKIRGKEDWDRGQPDSIITISA